MESELHMIKRVHENTQAEFQRSQKKQDIGIKEKEQAQ